MAQAHAAIKTMEVVSCSVNKNICAVTDSAHDTAGGFTSQEALNSAVSAHSVVASDSVDGISTPIPHADTSSAV